MRRDQPLRCLAVAAASVVSLAGCATGSRPTFASEAPVDDPAVAAVLDRLDHADGAGFTATYTITPTSTASGPTTATVSQVDGRRDITIGDVHFVGDGATTTTCSGEGEAADCVDHVDDARVSNLNITSQFWARSTAQRLEVDAGRNVADAVGHTETIAGNAAACADVPVVGGTVAYCALDAGVLARYIGADVAIELTSFSADTGP